MPSNSFSKVDLVQISLSDDEWISVKSELSWGEQEKLNALALRSIRNAGSDEQEIGLDIGRYNIERAATYLDDWCLFDGNGKPVPYSRSALVNLRPSVGRRILEVLDKHVEEQEKKEGERDLKPS